MSRVIKASSILVRPENAVGMSRAGWCFHLLPLFYSVWKHLLLLSS